MCYIILAWSSIEDLGIMYEDVEGKAEPQYVIFSSKSKAEKYAKENCAWNWKVVEIKDDKTKGKNKSNKR